MGRITSVGVVGKLRSLERERPVRQVGEILDTRVGIGELGGLRELSRGPR
jgi:hypothetical protein